MSKSLKPPGAAYWLMPEALAAMLAMLFQLFWMSPDMRHELPYPVPHSQTRSSPHWQSENNMGRPALLRAFFMGVYQTLVLVLLFQHVCGEGLAPLQSV